MQIITLKNFGAADVLELGDSPAPIPKSDEVLIRAHAAGINRPDILQRQGLYPAPADASAILGLEIAGEITENWR
jgi:NADPH2:quinone reductase